MTEWNTPQAEPEHSLEDDVRSTGGQAEDSCVPFSETTQECLADWHIYFQLLQAGKLDKYFGKYIVIFKGEVVAEGNDPTQLRREAAQQFSVDEERLVVTFIGEADYLTME